LYNGNGHFIIKGNSNLDLHTKDEALFTQAIVNGENPVIGVGLFDLEVHVKNSKCTTRHN